MDISTRKVLKRTLSTTNAHVELDNLINVEEKWGDASITVKEYTDYDVAEIPVIDASAIEQLKDDEIKMRHTHLYVEPDINEKIAYMNQYYIDNSMGPYAYAFTGDSPIGGDIMIPIPDSSIDSLRNKN